MEYYGEMPWLSLPFADRARKEKLSSKYGVAGIPTLVVLTAEGELVTKDGRSKMGAIFSGGDLAASSGGGSSNGSWCAVC